MQFSIEDCVLAPDKRQMDDLLGEYYDLMIARITSLGGSVADGGERAIEEFWQEIDEFLPPSGRLFLARTDSGELIGCGSLKSLDASKGELKRFYVKPQARGTGVGRKLVEMQIEAARKMGLKTLLVDTLNNNVEMRGLFQKFGFSEIDFYPQSATYRLVPHLLPLMCFYEITL